MRAAAIMMACLLAACSVLRPREPFSEAALFLRGQDYVTLHYKPKTMAQELVSDLGGAGYGCTQEAQTTRCVKVATASDGCFDVWVVDIQDPNVSTQRSRRCTGAVTPP